MYEGSQENRDSWLSKVYFDEQSKQLKLREPDQNSLMINKNIVTSILEFMQDRLLIYALPVDLLIAIGWQVVQRIIETDQGNNLKF